MTESEWIKKLERDGFTDVRVCPIPPPTAMSEHTHDEHTVHVLLTGKLIVTDADGTKTFEPGDRVEFPSGTRHTARGSIENGRMIIGLKKN
jgi:quercetin dioxygenase-like cupin family protein